MWHTDNFFKRMPVTPFILSAREVPSVEGNAKFASGRAAYSHLSEEMRQHMRSMMAIYDFAYSLSPVAPRLMTERQKRETPPVPQAAVRVNVSIGQKNLHMGTCMWSVGGGGTNSLTGPYELHGAIEVHVHARMVRR